VTEN
jgi:hypothetical protein